MVDTKIKTLVQRLIRGDIRHGDLKDIFLYARDRPDGRETVKEIGDFSAHFTERQKGIVTSATRDWIAIVIFHSPNIQNPGTGLDCASLPPIIKAYLSAMKSRLRPGTLKKRTGLNTSTAAKRIDKIIDKMTKNADGTWSFDPDDDRDLELLRCAVEVFVSQPAFTGEKLVLDLCGILKSSGAITADEIRNNKQLGRLFQLFAISSMHNCRITNSYQEAIRLRANSHDDGIHVDASVLMPGGDPGNSVFLSAPIFTSSISSKEGCEEELLRLSKWDVDIEISPRGLLCAVR